MATFWQQVTNRFKLATAPPQPARAGYVVDMHSHLLPDVDDGIRSLDEAMTCLRQFAEWGIEHVVTTPHISQDVYPNASALLRTVADEVRAQLQVEAIPITFNLAAEYMLDELFDKRLHQNDLLCFGTERYVLIETGWASLPRQLATWLFQLQVQGYKPVLAHPERYPYFRGKTEALAELRHQGCLMQLNLMSLTGRYGSATRKMAQSLIQQGLVDFVSSDLHHARDLPVLEKAMQTADYQLLCQLPLCLPTFTK
ncbi:tyrosine-protein phosphatase [Fibrella arboris]|uniref:tyrosine-protein phosphatase n=1 Tax=Fibrella arboris TaxID=3242486 RepID=UPI0035221576